MEPRVFKMGGIWGDKIDQWGNWTPPEIKVVGWKTPKPENGDRLLIPMQSGKNAIGVFTEVKPCGNPHDMFFADVHVLGYEDEEVEYPLPTQRSRTSVFTKLWRTFPKFFG